MKKKASARPSTTTRTHLKGRRNHAVVQLPRKCAPVQALGKDKQFRLPRRRVVPLLRL